MAFGKMKFDGKSGNVSFKWHGKAIEKGIRRHMLKRVKKAAYLVERRTKKNVSRKTTRVAGPSIPGSLFPHRDEGNLVKSIKHRKGQIESSTITYQVGTPLKYGLFLELGTSKMVARPFLRTTLDMSKIEIEQFITAPLPKLGP